MSTRPIKLTVIGQRIEIEDMSPVVAGSEGIYVANFSFDSCWDGYSKIAVFAAGWRSPVECLIRENHCNIPSEVLVAGERLRIGVYGIQDGKRLPTVWTSAIPVLPGATAGKPAQEPTPGITDQILTAMGDLDKLDTYDKSSLVAAINEARSTGGGGSYAPELVTITETDGIYVANKSFDKIKAAYDAGRTVIAQIGNDRLALNDCTDLRAYFLKMAATTVQVGLIIERDDSVYLGETVFATMEDIPEIPEIPEYLPNPKSITFTGASKETYDGSAAKTVHIPETPKALPSPCALTFTGAAAGSYDGSAPLEVNIPGQRAYTLPVASAAALGGVKPVVKTDAMTQVVGVDAEGGLFTTPGGGGGGKKKTVKLLDVTLEEDTAKISVTLDHDYPILMLVWVHGENGKARLVDTEGATVSGGYLKVSLDTDSYGWNDRHIARYSDDGKTWKTTSFVMRYTDDCSTFLYSHYQDITVGRNNVFQDMGGVSAMHGTCGSSTKAPTAGTVLNIISNQLFAATTRLILVGEYFE